MESCERWEHEGVGTQQQHGLVAKRELQKVMADVDINEWPIPCKITVTEVRGISGGLLVTASW